MLQRYKKQRAGQNGFVPPSIYQPLIFTFHLSIFTLQSYSGLEDGYFLVAFLFVVHEFAACYFDDILDEAFAGFLHRFVLDDNSGVEVYPARFVLCQSGVPRPVVNSTMWHPQEARAVAATRSFPGADSRFSPFTFRRSPYGSTPST